MVCNIMGVEMLPVMEEMTEDFGLCPWAHANFLWKVSDCEATIKGCNELWMPENDDMLGDLAEGAREVWWA